MYVAGIQAAAAARTIVLYACVILVCWVVTLCGLWVDINVLEEHNVFISRV
jgi:hypothetical protein